MKKEVKKLSDTEILEQYPIKSNIAGWYFRGDEVSNNVYLVEGTDKFGRKISLQGIDHEKLLKEAELEAEKINNAK